MGHTKCAGRTHIKGVRLSTYPCDKRGTLEHDGKLWCKTHHPPTAIAKQEARDAAWRARMRAESESKIQKLKSIQKDAAALARFRKLAEIVASVWPGATPSPIGQILCEVLDEMVAMHHEKQKP